MMEFSRLRLFLFSAVVLSTLGGTLADLCYDDVDDYFYCDSGCCGLYGDQYCCGWSTGGIAGASVGFFILFVVIVLIAVLCRRRYTNGYYWNRPMPAMTVVQPQATVATVSSVTQYGQPPAYYPGNRY